MRSRYWYSSCGRVGAEADGDMVAVGRARYLRLLTRLRPLFRVSAAAEIQGPENVAVQHHLYVSNSGFPLPSGYGHWRTPDHNPQFTFYRW